MNITNTESGKQYQLFPGTKLNIERTNPFFHDYGEQSVPVSLPDSSHNRQVLEHPHVTYRRNKVKMIEASISAGNFFSHCRQAILSVSPGEKIETSFYLNDGSFYSRLGETNMTDVFGEDTVPGVTTVAEALNFMKGLFRTPHPDFAAFQVEIPEGNQELRYLNVYYPDTDKLKAEEPQAETVDGKVISLPIGCYLTPFLRANYVLKRLFKHFGYTLNDNFFTRTEQFTNMVFINNVADAIVTGTIRLAQLVPPITCKEMLDLFRKKFLCEFLPDEVNRTVNVVLMNDIIDARQVTDLSDRLSGKLKIEYPSAYKQIILQPSYTISEDKSFDSLAVIKSKYPSVYFSEQDGAFICHGFNMSTLGYEFQKVVADSSQSYYEGGNLETEKVEIKECLPVNKGFILFIGEEQYLNSSLKPSQPSEDDKSSSPDKEDKQKRSMHPMLAFVFRDGKYVGGTVTNYGCTNWLAGTYVKIGDYSLVYNGANGIFEKFYRKYDGLLRNSLHTCSGDLLLTEKDKITLSPLAKYHLKGENFMLDTLSYSIGSGKTLSEIKLRTLRLYEPVRLAKSITQLFPLPPTDVKWVLRQDTVPISAPEYESSPVRDAIISDVFPPAPQKADIGKRFFEAKTAVQMMGAFYLTSSWLEVVPV